MEMCKKKKKMKKKTAHLLLFAFSIIANRLRYLFLGSDDQFDYFVINDTSAGLFLIHDAIDCFSYYFPFPLHSSLDLFKKIKKGSLASQRVAKDFPKNHKKLVEKRSYPLKQLRNFRCGCVVSVFHFSFASFLFSKMEETSDFTIVVRKPTMLASVDSSGDDEPRDKDDSEKTISDFEARNDTSNGDTPTPDEHHDTSNGDTSNNDTSNNDTSTSTPNGHADTSNEHAFPCHLSVLLSVGSEFFDTMLFANNSRALHEKRIVLFEPEVSPLIVPTLLEYFYNGDFGDKESTFTYDELQMLGKRRVYLNVVTLVCV